MDALLAAWPPDDPERAALQARARKYGRECGCALGGAFATAALVGAAVYLAAGHLGVATAAASVLLVFVAAGSGKLLGLLLASLRLVLLRRSLVRRLARQGA